MARRVAGVVSAGVAITIVLWLVTGPTASGFVKSALLAIIGSILVLYKFDEISAKVADLKQPAVTVPPPPTGGVFGTDLPVEAFVEPEVEVKPVTLSRGIRPEAEQSDLLLEARPIFTDAEEVEAEIESEEVVSTVAVEPANGTSSAVVHSEPTFIQLSEYTNADLLASVRAGEESLVSVLTESGMLSTEGALTDTDVATMVFVAVSSDDLLRVLLAGKQAEAEAQALSYAPDTPALYQPAPELIDRESQP